VHICGPVYLAGPFEVSVGLHGFLHEAAHVLLKSGMTLYGIQDKAMRRLSRLPGK